MNKIMFFIFLIYKDSKVSQVLEILIFVVQKKKRY